jgi:hypothetical protein
MTTNKLKYISEADDMERFAGIFAITEFDEWFRNSRDPFRSWLKFT